MWHNILPSILPWKRKADATAESAKIERIRASLAAMQPYAGDDEPGRVVYYARQQRDMLEMLQREQLDPPTLMRILTGMEATSEMDTRQQLEASRQITVRDIKRLRDLAPQQLSAIAILTARYLSSEQERLRMHHIDYVRTLPETNGFEAAELQRIYPLLLRFFWSPNPDEMQRLKTQNPLFTNAGPSREQIMRVANGQENISALSILYAPHAAEAAANGLYSWVTRSIETVFSHILRQEFNIEKLSRNAIARTSSRTAAFALLALMFGGGLFGQFELLRKTSKEMIETRVEMTTKDYEDQVKKTVPESFSLSPTEFESNKRELLSAMDAERDKLKRTQTIVVSKDASDLEILQDLRNLYTPTVADGAKGIATGAYDALSSTLCKILQKNDRWHQYSQERLTQLRSQLQKDLDAMFQHKDFIRAVKTDIKKGFITVKYADNAVEKYAMRGKDALAGGAKAVTTTALAASLRTTISTIMDTLNALLKLFWGTLTANQELKDDAKSYLTVVGAVIAALGVLGIVLAVWFGGALYGIVRVTRVAMRWSCKAGALTYKLLLDGLPQDVRLIAGGTTVFNLLTAGDLEQRKRLIQALESEQETTLSIS